MKVRYFEDTDTLYIQLKETAPSSTKEINTDLFAEIDKDGKVVALTIEHAKESEGKVSFSFETVAA